MSSIVIVGCGALGSHVIQFLRNEKESIHVIDFDRVESKNVASQFHSKTNTGKGKVLSITRTMDFLFGRSVLGTHAKLLEDNIDLLSHGEPAPSLVIDCLDNAATRRLVQRFCKQNKIPCLHGALAADGQYGRVVWSENFVIDEEAEAGAPTCEGHQHLPFIALTSAYLARAAQTYLRQGKRIGFAISPAGAVCI